MPHIHKLPSNNWRVIVKHRGMTVTATAGSKAAATLRGAELLLELGGTPKNPPTVAELVEGHLANIDLSPTTRADYENIRGRIPDEFMQRKVDKVTPMIAESLFGQLARQGLTAHRIRRTRDLLRSAWSRAIRYEWALRNPFSSARVPPIEEHEIHPPSPEQVTTLIDAAPSDFADYIQLAASTGARRGELVALRWTDIDFDKATVSIRRSVVYTPASGVVERPTKTGKLGHRTIAVGLPTMAALRRRRAAQVEKALAAGVTAMFVFSHTAGATSWHPDYPTTAFTRTRNEAGLPTVRLHDLRHYVATQMMAAGYSVRQVADRLGQTQMATAARYSHWIPAKDREAADMLEALPVADKSS